MLSMTSLFLIIHLTLQVTSQVLMQFQPVCHLTDYCTEMYSLVLCSVFTGQNNTKYWQLFFSKSAAEVACLRCSFLLYDFVLLFLCFDLVCFLFFSITFEIQVVSRVSLTVSVLFLMFEKFYFRLCLSRGRFYSFRMNKTGQTDHILKVSIGRQGFSKWQILRWKKFPLYLFY